MPKLALYVPLQPKPGKEREVADFQGGPRAYAVFDTFDTEGDRQAHLDGKGAAALMDKADELFSEPPQIHKFTLLAAK